LCGEEEEVEVGRLEWRCEEIGGRASYLSSFFFSFLVPATPPVAKPNQRLYLPPYHLIRALRQALLPPV
jgi:hypothetical protein